MPYHSTSIFLSLLSILPRQLPPTFRFLYPYTTRLANPPIKAIAHAASNNRPFFAAFNGYTISVSQARHQYPALISFWVSVASQAIDGMLSAALSGRESIQRQNLEEILLFILPVLNDGLALAEIGSLTEACCTVIMVIASKGILSDKVTGGLMKAITNVWPEATIDVRLICLALLAQERGTRRLQKAVTKALLQLENCPTRLAILSRSYRVDTLALSYALGCVIRMSKTEGTQEAHVVQSILEAEILNDKQRKILVMHLLEQPRNRKGMGDLNVQHRRNHARLVVFLSESERQREILEVALMELNMNVEELRHLLQIDIPLVQRRNEDSEEMQIEPSSQDEPSLTKPLDNRFIALSQMEPRPRSFMDLKEWTDFNSLAEGFVEMFAFTVPSSIRDNFLKLPVLRRDSALIDPTYVSFLIRIWSGRYPVSSRVAALDDVSDLFSEGFENLVRIQWAIPYLVIALADENKIVRQSSAKVIKVLSGLDTRDKEIQPNGKSREMTWGFQELYPGSTSTLESLTVEDVRHLVQVSLLPELEACVLDRSVIIKVIQNTLTGTSSKKADMFAYFACHAAVTPLLTIQSALIMVLSGVNKNSSNARSKLLRPCVETWIGLSAKIARARCEQEKVILSEIDTAMISIVRAKDEGSIQMLRQVLQGLKANARLDIQEAAFGRLKQIWSSIPTNEQQTLAVLLRDNALDTKTENTATHLKDFSLETLGGLKLSTEILTALLNSLTTAVQMPENPPSAKRRRTSRSETSRVEIRDSDELAQTLRRYTFTLELVENSSPEKHPELLKPLFHCLGEIQHYKFEMDSGLVYLQELVINSLLGIVRNVKDSKDVLVDKSVIRTDLLVDCIRHTTNPQVQNAALLLVSGLSRWVPEAVLHSVMPIFTFMGSTTLRQSDDYSAHVIHQTISQVIPPLVGSLRKSSRHILNGVVDLLLSFVAAFEHMPQHRRLGLFKKVMTALGPEDCLFAVLVMLVDRYPMDDRVSEVLPELLDQFDARVQLLVFEQYIDLLIDLTKPRRGVSEIVLNLREKSKDEIHMITYNLLEALAGLLENPRIRLRIDRSFNGDESQISTQRHIFAKLIQGAIKNAQSFSSQRDLEERAGRVLSDVFQLVPLVELLRSAEPLIQQSIDDVRQVVLTAIYEQAENVKSTDTDTKSALLDFIPHITFIIKNSAKSYLKRTAIACVDQISDRFGKQDASKINEAARIISGPDALGQSDNAVRIISLLCLASMVDVLREDFIPLLPDLFSQIFEYLRLSIEDMERHTGLHNACFTLINAIVEHLPFMFTGSILDTSLQLAQASGACELDIGVHNFRSQFYQLVTEKLSASELFPALTRNSLQPEQVENLNSILEYAEFAKATVEHHSKSAVSKNASTLFDLVLQGFDYYKTLATRRPNMEVGQAAFDQIESIFLEIAVSLTMKLNDVTFRPLFVRLVEWVNELPKDDRLGKSYRATALFQFFKVLSGKLKSLVTAYSSYVLELAAELLESTNNKSENADRLLRAILGALEESFEHDQDDFWQSPSHFETICMPLLSSLSKSNGNILANSVIPTITALAATATSQDHHKTINSQILQLMRNDMRDTRLAAVKCEQALTERLGEEWLVLLPEMLPFITELLEDDDGEVERESRQWIKRVEEILGESLEGMLQ